MYWCRREDFEAIGGFDERVTTIDDLDFARRLRDHGLRTGRKFVNLRQAPVTTVVSSWPGGSKRLRLQPLTRGSLSDL